MGCLSGAFGFFGGLGFQRKFLLFTLSMIVFMGGMMGLHIRFIIFPYLTHEMENRGANIARRLAESTRTLILTQDTVRLTSVLFEEKELEQNIAYITVSDNENRLLAHTLLGFLPNGVHAPLVSSESENRNYAAIIDNAYAKRVSDIAIPVYEGLFRIGTIRVGLDKQFIHIVMRKLNLFHMAFISLVTLVALIYGVYLSRVITKPITSLTMLAGRIGMGDLNTYVNLGQRQSCWELRNCGKTECPAYGNDVPRCWFVDHTMCDTPPAETFPGKLNECKDCTVRKKQMGDEIVQLTDTFNHMVHRLRISEIRLRSSEERYRLLFNCDPNPIFVVDVESGIIIDANDRATEVFGYPKESLLGMKFIHLGFQDDALADVVFNSFSCGEKRNSLVPKVRLRKNGGESFWVNVYLQCYEHLGNRAVIATTTDITEIIEAETKLIQAGKMTTLGEMATGIAHELNQPLNAIKIGSEFLQKVAEQGGAIPDEELTEVAHEISKDVDRAAAIINHLREFGRKSDIIRQRIDVNKAITGVFTILGQQLKVHGIEVRTDLDASLPPIMADENRIEQVLINLVSNARDAIDAKQNNGHCGTGVLAIKSFHDGERVVVTVSDSGSGIPERIRGRIFEPFFTTKEVGKGTGLGLSISYGIVTDYEGTIDFETQEGLGTTFKISFPKAPEERRDG